MTDDESICRVNSTRISLSIKLGHKHGARVLQPKYFSHWQRRSLEVSNPQKPRGLFWCHPLPLRFAGAYWQHGVNYTCRPWTPSDYSWLVLMHWRLADKALEGATVTADQHCVLVGDLMTTTVHPMWTVVVIRLLTTTQFCSAGMLAPMGHLEVPPPSTCWCTTNVISIAHHIQTQIKIQTCAGTMLVTM